MSLQTITMPHGRFRATRRSYTWVHKYIFPGGLIPSEPAIADALSAGLTPADRLQQRDRPALRAHAPDVARALPGSLGRRAQAGLRRHVPADVGVLPRLLRGRFPQRRDRRSADGAAATMSYAGQANLDHRRLERHRRRAGNRAGRPRRARRDQRTPRGQTARGGRRPDAGRACRRQSPRVDGRDGRPGAVRAGRDRYRDHERRHGGVWWGPCSQSRCATRLRHVPSLISLCHACPQPCTRPGARYQAAPNCSAAIQRASDIVSRSVPVAVTASPSASSSRQPSCAVPLEPEVSAAADRPPQRDLRGVFFDRDRGQVGDAAGAVAAHVPAIGISPPRL